MKANLHQLTYVQMNDMYFVLHLFQLFDVEEYLQDVNTGNLPYPSIYLRCCGFISHTTLPNMNNCIYMVGNRKYLV